MRVKVSPRRCSGESIIPTVATGPQSVKRDEKAVSESPSLETRPARIQG